MKTIYLTITEIKGEPIFDALTVDQEYELIEPDRLGEAYSIKNDLGEKISINDIIETGMLITIGQD